jgi:hypothetical protein
VAQRERHGWFTIDFSVIIASVYAALMRSYRELWLWLGAAFLALFAAFIAIGLAYFTKKTHFSFYASWEAWASVAAFIPSFACFFCAIFGTPFPPWTKAKFPNICMEIWDFSNQVVQHTVNAGPSTLRVVDARILAHQVRITNLEREQNASLTISLFLKLAPDSRGSIDETTGFIPSWPLDPGLGLDKIRMPIILAPGTSVGGALVYEISMIDSKQGETIAQPLRVRFRIVDHISGRQGDLTLDADLRNADGYGNFSRDDMVITTA